MNLYINSREFILTLPMSFGFVITIARLLQQGDYRWPRIFTNSRSQVNPDFCVYKVTTELREIFADPSTENVY
jgi:hypothetical protein